MLKLINSLGMLLFFILLCLAAGQIGTFFTTEDSYHWYQLLNKPTFTPPSFIFPLVWTFVYLLMAVAAWLVWRSKNASKVLALTFWSLQLILNAFWTPVFFGQQLISYGLFIMAILWAFVFVTTVLFFKVSRPAGVLMLLYLLWVSFAGILNFMIWFLNR